MVDQEISPFDNILTKKDFSHIEKMIDNFKKDKSLELEVSFRNVNYSNYMRIIEHFVNVVDENNISSEDSLDISVILPEGNNYRTSLISNEQINDFFQKYSKSTVSDIQRFLLKLKPQDDINIIFKDRGTADKLYIEDFDILLKTTIERPIKDPSKENIKLTGNEKIHFRYKQRSSFILNDLVRLDVTEVKESKELSNLFQINSNYEVEIEVINSKINLNTLISQIVSILKIVQDAEFPIGKKEEINVIETYRQLLKVKPSLHLDGRNVVSIDSAAIVKYIPNKYAVTDKADGDRYFLISTTQGVYLLSINLTVKKLNVKVTDKKYHNMIIDGELIKNENGKIFLAFDVVYANDTDYRHNNELTLIKRLDVLYNIINDCFGTLIPFTDYTNKNSDMELDNIKSFYLKELQKYWTQFRKEINKIGKDKIYITRKLYFVPYGIDPNEIFMYADMLWKFYVYQNFVPYKLDGIIYTPISSSYMIKSSFDSVDSGPVEYKWKPPSKNSIDFYITFIKDANGAEAVYIDNSVVSGKGNPYKICKLHVGVTKGREEKPVPFKINGKEQMANIYLTDNEARDIEGKVIDDETVVEFIFDAFKQDIDDAYKWIPIKTRYDKTESVQKYGKKYGNNVNIAIKIWKTIINPITEENIASLANPTTYQKEMDRLSKSTATYNKQNHAYYQLKSNSAKGMRSFHNWIKSNIILTYCKNKHNVLDIGCGRGGDLIKFVDAKIDEYVGVDIDANGLFIINDSAHSRYKHLKKTHSNVPPMYFINADARALFTVQSQQNIFPSMGEFNKKLIETHLSSNKKYDVINAQFTLHYYLSDEFAWNNFCTNINNHIQRNGYFLITTFDGKLLYDKLMGKSKMTVSYTDNKGSKNIFFEIIKIYNDNDKSNLGMAIDLYNSLISNPGTYIREYLVFPDFLEKSLKEKCGLELVESDYFFNLFNLYKNYFIGNTSQSTLKTFSKKYNEIRDFYLSLQPDNNNLFTVEQSEAALCSFKLSILNRYYVFKKSAHVDLENPSRIIGINNGINLGKIITPFLDRNNIIIDVSKKNGKINEVYRYIKNQHKHINPSVYLIKHTIDENDIGHGDIYRTNRLRFLKLREGSDPQAFLIYKSPEKEFFPIYYQNTEFDKNIFSQNRYTISQNSKKMKKSYVLDSPKVIEDLHLLINLTQTLQKKQ